MKAGERAELLLYESFQIAQSPFLYARRDLGLDRFMFHVKHESIGIRNIKRGIGALYELCAPSTTPHSSFLTPHYKKVV